MQGHNDIVEEIQPIEDEGIEDEYGDDVMIEGFNFDNLHGSEFNPMSSLGQFMTTENGESIADVLLKISCTLSTLTKILHKISKSLDK